MKFQIYTISLQVESSKRILLAEINPVVSLRLIQSINTFSVFIVHVKIWFEKLVFVWALKWVQLRLIILSVQKVLLREGIRVLEPYLLVLVINVLILIWTLIIVLLSLGPHLHHLRLLISWLKDLGWSLGYSSSASYCFNLLDS